MQNHMSVSLSPIAGSGGNEKAPPSNKTVIRLSMEIVKIKRIPQREFEPAATTVVSLDPSLVPVSSGPGADEYPIIHPATFATQQVATNNDPYYNDKVDFTTEVATVGGSPVEAIQGFPAGVTLPTQKSHAADSDASKQQLPTIPRPPSASMAAASLIKRRSTIAGGTSAPPSPPKSGKGSSPVTADIPTPSGPSALPAISSTTFTAPPPLATPLAPAVPKGPFFRIPITVTDHNKAANPLAVLYGMLEIPATQTKFEVTINVILSPTAEGASAATVKDEIDVIAPLLCVRYKVAVQKPPKEPVDYHADVLLETEPVYKPTHQLVPDVTQFSWYHLLNDRPWLVAFSQALIHQWSALPKIVYENDRAKSPKPKRGDRPPTGGFARSSSRGAGAGAVSYKSIADLMLNHWSVKRSHEAVTKIRICADKHMRGESMAFTAMEEYTLKVQWRERQVLRTTMAIDALEDYSASQVRSLLERLWLNMVYGVPADDPQPPVLTYDMRSKLQSIPFTNKHASILRACMLQQLVSGLTYADALKVATEDFETKNVTYASRRGSLIGGEYTKSEAIMMAYGVPTLPVLPPPTNPVKELDQIARLLEDNKKNLKSHQRRSRSIGKHSAAHVEGEDPANATMATMNGTMMTANATMLGATFANSTLNGSKDGHATSIMGTGPNGVSRRESDVVAPLQYSSQQIFTTVVIDFVGRLLETLTDHEFILILTAFIPAVTAASEKCLMVASGLPSTFKAVAKRSGSAKKRSGSARKKRSSSTVSKPSTVGEHLSGPVQIEYLDALGRKLPKIQAGGGQQTDHQQSSPMAPEADGSEAEDANEDVSRDDRNESAANEASLSLEAPVVAVS